MIWRDIKVRYKQTVLGAAWAIIQPVLTMLVFKLHFWQCRQSATDGIPYPIFALHGTLPWACSARHEQCQPFTDTNVSMVTKIYFPRLVLPLARLLGNLVDFAMRS